MTSLTTLSLETRPGYATKNRSQSGGQWNGNTRIIDKEEIQKFCHLLEKNHVFCNLGQVRGCPYGFSESGIYNQFCVLLGDIEEAEHVSFKREARKKNGKFVLTKPGPIIAH